MPNLFRPDFIAAQMSDKVGYVPLLDDLPTDDTPTQALPHPDDTTPFVPTTSYGPTSSNWNTWFARNDLFSRLDNKDVETPPPMTQLVASEWNDVYRNPEKVSKYEKEPVPTWNPWHPGYSRVPRTVAPDKKNPALHDEAAYQKMFGPRPADWRKDNPAGWFNYAIPSTNGVNDWEAYWDTFMRQHGPDDNVQYANDEERLAAWEKLKKENLLSYLTTNNVVVGVAQRRQQDLDANLSGPFSDSYDPDNTDPYNQTIYFPDKDAFESGYSNYGIIDFLTHSDKYSILNGLPMWEVFPERSETSRRTGIHEGTHNIIRNLSNVGMGPAIDPSAASEPDDPTSLLVRSGHWYQELPTVHTESIYGNNGKFVPLKFGPIVARDADDLYLEDIQPRAESLRTYFAGEARPEFKDYKQYEDLDNSIIPVPDPADMFARGIRYWNMPHDKDRAPDSLSNLRFIPDHPTGWYYDKFGRKRFSGGELVNYHDLWGNGEPKNMEDLPPNFRRDLDNLGNAPQAWIDSIDNPKEYAEAQDRVRRLMFPLLTGPESELSKDNTLGTLVRTLWDVQHPAYNFIKEQLSLNGLDKFDPNLTDDEIHRIESDIMDKVYALYPELRIHPEATPSYLVNAQRIFGILPELGTTGVRTLEQYNNIAKYIEYYRKLDEYIQQYGPQGGNSLSS